MSKTWSKISALFGDKDISVFFDYRGMIASDGEPAVFLPEVAEKAGMFQKKLTSNINRLVTLCNSEYMKQQLNHVSAISNNSDRSLNLFGNNKEMIGKAYELLGIIDNELIKATTSVAQPARFLGRTIRPADEGTGGRTRHLSRLQNQLEA
ncbi:MULTISPECIES: hypothetical protein [unclassified Paenibacillus]|uniref:hypothetical protein n=1 Tax=unclassified Paenibacillus TaxID=185978 RepID=UPI00159FA4B0|nr:MULTISPECIES: hypothetical protein [unclassified Paenibacillus]